MIACLPAVHNGSLSEIGFMLQTILDAAKPEFSMGWDIVLLVVPLLLALVLNTWFGERPRQSAAACDVY